MNARGPVSTRVFTRGMVLTSVIAILAVPMALVIVHFTAGGKAHVVLTPPAGATEAELNLSAAILTKRFSQLHLSTTARVHRGAVVLSYPPNLSTDVITRLAAPGRFSVRRVVGTRPVAAAEQLLSRALRAGVVLPPAVLDRFLSTRNCESVSRLARGALPTQWLVGCDADDSIYLMEPTVLTGGGVKSAFARSPDPQSSGPWRVEIGLSVAGQAAFTRLTQQAIGGEVAFALDGLVVRTSMITEPIAVAPELVFGSMGEAALETAAILGSGTLPFGFSFGAFGTRDT